MPEIGFNVTLGHDSMTMESGNCILGNSDGYQIAVGQANVGARFASAVSARVFAIVRSGHNRFEDRHGGHFLKKADGSGWIAAKNERIAGSGTARLQAGTSGNTIPGIPEGRAICWGDDNLDTGDTEVMLVIANGPGYTVNPERSTHTFTIRDNDSCANPAATPGGVVYKMDSGGRSCTCATQSRNSQIRKALTPYTRGDVTIDPSQNTGFLSSLAEQFHDPSYLYCEESPYRGLGS